MKKLNIILLSLFFTLPFRLIADEGMWLISLVQTYNYEKARAIGLKLPADKIYNENSPSLKDAVVSFGDFCTAEFVSKDGLLFTNHHCGYDAIASLSTVEKNYLDNGYWAKNRSEEIPVPGLFVKALVRMQEVTDSILPKLNGLDGQERIKKVNEIIAGMSANANPDKKYKVEIKPFYSGNQYFMFIYQVYNDVRFVGAPPSSIGKFGGDTDNWMWPRHTGDFSVFRVYADGENKPTAYNETNKPFNPKYHLSVNISPLKQGDYTMIIGYPGRTDRYQTSFGLNYVQNIQNPTYINIFTAVTQATKSEMDKDDALRLKLASSYASQMNSLKLFQGQLDGFARINPVPMKKKEEADFTTWVKSLPASEQGQYSNILSDLESIYKQYEDIAKPMFYPFMSTSLLPSMQFAGLLATLREPLSKKGAKEELAKAIDETRISINAEKEAYISLIDQNALIAILKAYNKNVDPAKQASIMKDILSTHTNSDVAIETYVRSIYAKSFIATSDKMMAFLNKPSLKTLNSDPVMKLYDNLLNTGMEYRGAFQQLQLKQQAATRSYLKGIMAMRGLNTMYPDANFTMRLTYGTVEPFDPRDAVKYNWQTTANGIIEKYIPGDEEFDVPQALRDAISKKNYGRYGVRGELPVCFLSTNDITGGNSGSPIMDANGNWIGLAFDGNYEGTACQYIFEVPMNRTINVSINYVLFLVDKVYGAGHLVNEMTFAQ
jgi:hypothetical protein